MLRRLVACLDALSTNCRQFINIHQPRDSQQRELKMAADVCNRRVEWPDAQIELLVELLEKNECLWKTTANPGIPAGLWGPGGMISKSVIFEYMGLYC